MLEKTEYFGSSSFHGQTFFASVDDIKAVFGEESYVSDISDKSQHEWVLENENGEIVNIYDWKEYRRYSNSDVIEWHIGTLKSETSVNALKEIKSVLNRVPKK